MSSFLKNFIQGYFRCFKGVQSKYTDNENFFLDHQISILEWFLKDHVALKTGVMPAENSALQLQK